MLRNGSGFAVISLALVALFFGVEAGPDPYTGCRAVEECRQAQGDLTDHYQSLVRAWMFVALASVAASVGLWSHLRAREDGIASGDRSGEKLFQ